MHDKKSRLKVCVVIPAFNEAIVIKKVILDVLSIFQKTNYLTEVVVVNDASSDNTGVIAKKQGATVINHIINTGAGGATATGLSYAEQNGFDIAATMDADGQHLSSDLLNGINKIAHSNIDLLIGSRLIVGSSMSKTKIIGNKGLSVITNFLFGINSTDSQSGLRIFSRKSLRQLRWKTNGYEFCSEMLWRARQQNLNIDEYPIKSIYTNYSKLKGQNNWNGINIVKSLVRRRIMEMFE